MSEKWENVVEGEELKKARTERGKTYEIGRASCRERVWTWV